MHIVIEKKAERRKIQTLNPRACLSVYVLAHLAPLALTECLNQRRTWNNDELAEFLFWFGELEVVSCYDGQTFL